MCSTVLEESSAIARISTTPDNVAYWQQQKISGRSLEAKKPNEIKQTEVKIFLLRSFTDSNHVFCREVAVVQSSWEFLGSNSNPEGRMYKTLAIATAVTIGAASSTYGADLIIAPVAAPVTYQSSGFDWSGFYAGLVGGYSWGTVETTEVPPPNPTWKVNPNGAMLGVTAGVNAQFDQFVLGAEGEIMWAGITGSGPDPRAPLTTTISTKSDWQGALKLRAGVAIDRVLVYAHGGLAFADLKSSVLTPGVQEFNYNTVRTGLTIGAGVEAAVTDQISVKAEYAYSDFGTWNGTYTGTPGPFDVEQKYAAHSIKVGINFHF